MFGSERRGRQRFESSPERRIIAAVAGEEGKEEMAARCVKQRIYTIQCYTRSLGRPTQWEDKVLYAQSGLSNVLKVKTLSTVVLSV